MNQKQLIILLYSLLFLIRSNFIFGQETSSNILWDKTDKKPISYATIKGIENSSISNEDGVFEFQKTAGKITIQNVVYETLEVDFNFLKAKDTIFMKPLTYQLDEVVISKDGLYTQMLKTILTDCALEPHNETFFLRAVVRKNNELYKIVDFSGMLEKQTLFDTKSKPMPKNNYKVQVDNIRKVGLDDREVDILMFSFQEFFTNLIQLSINKDEFNLTYASTAAKESKRITFEPKNKGKSKGYYILNEDNSFKEAAITYSNYDSKYDNKGDVKFRTTKSNWISNFERNRETGLLQLSKGKLSAKMELVRNDVTEIYEFTYIYNSNPIKKNVSIKNNINLKKDMFKLKGKYNPNYWENHDVLTLTNEMQEFINNVNSLGKNSDFKTRTNIN